MVCVCVHVCQRGGFGEKEGKGERWSEGKLNTIWESSRSQEDRWIKKNRKRESAIVLPFSIKVTDMYVDVQRWVYTVHECVCVHVSVHVPVSVCVCVSDHKRGFGGHMPSSHHA